MRLLRSSLLPIVFSLLAAHTAAAQTVFDNVDYTGGARSHRFDLLHVAIDVRFDIPNTTVIGSVNHRMRSLAPGLGSITIDAGSNMTFSRVEVDGAPARYAQRGDSLDIVLPRARQYNDTFTVAIDYRVSPRKGLYFIQPDSLVPNRRKQIWTQGEAEDNRYWMPIYDYPNDRATSELRATVPAGWKVLSNGTLISTSPGKESGTSTWHWRMSRPHSTYLIMMAAGEYLVTRDTADGVPLEYWTYPERPEAVKPSFGRTPDVMRYMISLLGPYPWDKYAQVMIANFMYGGMENTTATTLNDYALVDERGLIDYNPDGLIAHEAAHQWFGDMVTNRSWKHLWLHESYATYLASRYMGHRYGEEQFLKEMYDNGQRGIMSEQTRGRDPLAGGDGVTANIYQRGSRVLHMLNRLVGEELFWRANRQFLQRHAYGLVETNDLKIAFEEATGLDLGWFFDQWIYRAGSPVLQVEKSWKGNTLTLNVRQTQERDSLTGLFRIAIPLEFHLNSGIVTDTVLIAKEEESFTFTLPERPRFMIFDAGDATLKTLQFPRPAEELVAQLGAPRGLDRYLAVAELTSADMTLKGGRDAQRQRSVALRELYEREASWFVREIIIEKSSTLDTMIATEIITRGLRDPVADVRQKAVENSFMIGDKKLRASLLRPLMNDSSYNVIAATLGMLAVTDTADLESALREMKGMRGRRDRLALAWLGAVLAGRYRSLADDVTDYTLPAFANDTRVQAYYVLSKLDTTTPKIREAVARGLREQTLSLRSAAASAARAHLDLEMREILEGLRSETTGNTQSLVEEILRERRQ